jgi:hypothetical protein
MGHRFTLLDRFLPEPASPLAGEGWGEGNKRGIRKVGFLDENETLYI